MPEVNKLWILRHGESAGNLAWAAAEEADSHYIDVASSRDADVPLSPLGERQARAVGRWFGAQPPGERPTVVISSPYVRATHTAKLVIEAGQFDGVPLLLDERLREKEFGIFNKMTAAGVIAKMPEQAALRETLGKFYFRPPGGESWCDIVLRLRSLWRDLRAEHEHERVLIVCHSVVTFCLRYIVEGLSEREILDIDIACDVANCGLTSYQLAPGAPGGRPRLALERFNFVAPMEEAGERVTSAKDAPLPK